jgi:hypothetical protein
MMIPSVHLNGTSRDELQRECRKACEAVVKAMQALGEMAPDGRDYYPQGPNAFHSAAAEWRTRYNAMEKIHSEILEIWTAIAA